MAPPSAKLRKRCAAAAAGIARGSARTVWRRGANDPQHRRRDRKGLNRIEIRCRCQRRRERRRSRPRCQRAARGRYCYGRRFSVSQVPAGGRVTASGGHKRLAIGGGRRWLDAFDLDVVSRARQAQRIASHRAACNARRGGGGPSERLVRPPFGPTLRARRRLAARTPMAAQAEHRPSFSPAQRR